jgi:hypothetical protein
MKIPGFTAEVSLYKAGESHNMMNGMQTAALITEREIIPQAMKICYDLNGKKTCKYFPVPYQWWKRWPDLIPGPTPWSIELPGTEISLQEMISI